MLRVRTAISRGTPVRWPAWSTLLRLQGFCSDITTTERRRDACSSFFYVSNQLLKIFSLNWTQIKLLTVCRKSFSNNMLTTKRPYYGTHFLAEHQARLGYLQTFKPSYQLFLDQEEPGDSALLAGHIDASITMETTVDSQRHNQATRYISAD